MNLIDKLKYLLSSSDQVSVTNVMIHRADIELVLFQVSYSCSFSIILYCNILMCSILQLVKLLELREANHIEFCKIKNVVDEVLQMYRNSELNDILKLLMDPTWVATGLKIGFDKLVSDGL